MDKDNKAFVGQDLEKVETAVERVAKLCDVQWSALDKTGPFPGVRRHACMFDKEHPCRIHQCVCHARHYVQEPSAAVRA